MPTFDVLTEPWIEVEPISGREHQFAGILGALTRAQKLKSVHDSSPLVEFGILRLLTAFAYDAYEHPGPGDLADMIEEGSFSESRLRGYAEACGNVFDLFDECRPFLQASKASAPAEKKTAGTLSPVIALTHHLPSGSNAIHHGHVNQDEQAFSPVVCARLLTTIAPFMTAGGAGLSPSVNGTPPWYVLLRGRNLFETIALNMPALTGQQNDPGIPAWRDSEDVVPKQEVRDIRILPAFTWQPRLLRLVPEEPGGSCTYSGRESPVLVRRIVLKAGQKAVNEEAQWRDPNVAYRTNERGRFPVRVDDNRPAWTDIGPLLLLKETEDHVTRRRPNRYERAAVIGQYLNLRQTQGILGDRQHIEADCFAVRSDGKMKLFEWRHESYRVPEVLLENSHAIQAMQFCVDLAVDLARAIGYAIGKACPRDGAGQSAPLGRTVRNARKNYWLHVQSIFENELLGSLPGLPEGREHTIAVISGWIDRIARVASNEVHNALKGVDADGASLRRQVKADDALLGSIAFLRKKLNPADEQEPKPSGRTQ